MASIHEANAKLAQRKPSIKDANAALPKPTILQRLGRALDLPEVRVPGTMLTVGGDEGISIGTPGLTVRPSDMLEGIKALGGVGDRKSTLLRRGEDLMNLPKALKALPGILADDEKRGAVVDAVKDNISDIAQDPQKALRGSVRSGDAFIDAPLTLAGGGAAARMTKLSDTVNPIKRLGRALMDKTKEKVDNSANALADIVGEKSGVKSGVLQVARRIGNEGDEIPTGQNVMDVAENVVGGIRKAKSDNFDSFATKFRRLREDPSNPVDRVGVKNALLDPHDGFLASRGLSIAPDQAGRLTVDFTGPKSRFRTASSDEKNLVQELVDEMQLLDGAKNVEELQAIIQNIKTLERRALRLSEGKASGILTPARKKLTEEMNEKVDGFRALNKEFGEVATLVDRLENAFLRNGQVEVDEKTISALGNLMGDLQRNKFRKEALDELGQRLGVDFEKEIAGLTLDQSNPRGLAKIGAVGSGGVGGVVGGIAGNAVGGTIGAVAGTAIGGAAVAVLRAMTISNPRAAGRMFRALGATERKAQKIEQYINKVAGALPEGFATDAMTVGAALDVITRRGSQSIFAKLGRQLAEQEQHDPSDPSQARGF